jgi:phage tail sheath protein FI
MPITPTYPGVYIEEISSGVRTITGVSTSDTAFVDFFAQGPINIATRITSFADFQRTFGGLHPQSEASYAVQQYYLNGGQIAWVVRVDSNDTGTAAKTATLTLQSGGNNVLKIDALNPGAWGNNIQVAVDQSGIPLTKTNSLFNLTVQQVNPTTKQVLVNELYSGVTMDSTQTRYIANVVNSASTLVQVTVEGQARPDNSPTTGSPKLSSGSDTTLMDSQGNIASGKDNDFATSLIGSDTLTIGTDNIARKSGLYALGLIAPYIFNILCLPATAKISDHSQRLLVLQASEKLCLDKRAFLIMDIPFSRKTLDDVQNTATGFVIELDNDTLRQENAAVYFPNLTISDPLNSGKPRQIGVSGTMAGIYATTDAERGVWKAPAGIDATLQGVSLNLNLTDLENGSLNPLGINVLRNFPIYGTVSWGARTLKGDDQEASEWKYIPVRRTALFIEESLYQGLKWVVFEPNDESLWAQIRLNVGSFMNNLFRQGAFQGKTPTEAYLVKCDSETTTQNDINLGIVNIVVGFAPLKPAEFVILQIQQLAGQIAV